MGRFLPPSQKVEVDVRLDEVVLRALEKERELRYQRVTEVKTDLDRLRVPAQAAPRRTTSPWLWLLVAGLGLGVLACVGMMAVALLLGVRRSPEVKVSGPRQVTPPQSLHNPREEVVGCWKGTWESAQYRNSKGPVEAKVLRVDGKPNRVILTFRAERGNIPGGDTEFEVTREEGKIFLTARALKMGDQTIEGIALFKLTREGKRLSGTFEMKAGSLSDTGSVDLESAPESALTMFVVDTLVGGWKGRWKSTKYKGEEGSLEIDVRRAGPTHARVIFLMTGGAIPGGEATCEVRAEGRMVTVSAKRVKLGDQDVEASCAFVIARDGNRGAGSFQIDAPGLQDSGTFEVELVP